MRQQQTTKENTCVWVASGTAWTWLELAQDTLELNGCVRITLDARLKYAENTSIILDTEVCSEDQYCPVFVVYITQHSVCAGTGSGSWLCVGSQIGLI